MSDKNKFGAVVYFPIFGPVTMRTVRWLYILAICPGLLVAFSYVLRGFRQGIPEALVAVLVVFWGLAVYIALLGLVIEMIVAIIRIAASFNEVAQVLRVKGNETTN